MFNYHNLDDIEFEELCKDVMQKELNTELRTFGKGRDGGIDLKDNVPGCNIIVQVKHYINSTVSNLLSSLNNEVEKVQKLNPKKYYVCCSKELSSPKTTEIYNLFDNYMESEKNIYTLKEIDDFLQRPENADIVRKNFKLWLESSNILSEIYNQDIFIDCKVLLNDIKEEYKFYVQTISYNESIEILSKERTLILIGSPGVGKTVTSKMLILYYANEDYRVRYTTNGEISSIKKAISTDKDTKEVILLDDCLGQYYFKMKDTQENELISLIKYIKSNPKKILILNSRVTIFNEAKEHSLEFCDFITNKKINIKTIDMDKISPIEKAKIFYNNLYFNNIPPLYYQSIRNNRNYYKIINHKNYNPRIIEYVTQPERYSKVKSDEYFEFIMNNLNNPEDVWKNEFTKRITSIDRIFMLILFSLTDTNVKYETMRECFNKRLELINDIDTTIDNFKTTLSRLNKSMIKIIDNNGKREISVLNPSINDYLKGIFYENCLELNNIKKSIIYYEQIKRCYDENEIESLIIEKINDKSILKLKMEHELEQKGIETLLLYKICEFQIMLENYIPNVKLFIENIWEYGKDKMFILSKLLHEPLYSYYRVNEFISNISIITTILESFENEELIDIMEMIYSKLKNKNDKSLLEEFKGICIESMKENMVYYVDGFKMDEYIYNLDLDDYFAESKSKTYMINGKVIKDRFELEACFTDDVIDTLKEEAESNLKSKLKLLVNKLSIEEIKGEINNYLNNINLSEYIEESDIQSVVESYLQPSYDDRYGDDDYYIDNSKYNEIDYIFDRTIDN